MSPPQATHPGARRHLRRLGPEPWGSRLARARESYPGGKLTQADAAEWLAAVTLGGISDPTTVSRLEARDTLPAGRKSASLRRNAYLLSILYLIDPTELDLSDDDGPGELAIARLRKSADTRLDNGAVILGYLRRNRPLAFTA